MGTRNYLLIASRFVGALRRTVCAILMLQCRKLFAADRAYFDETSLPAVIVCRAFMRTEFMIAVLIGGELFAAEQTTTCFSVQPSFLIFLETFFGAIKVTTDIDSFILFAADNALEL